VFCLLFYSYDSMKNVCDRYNRALDSILNLVISTIVILKPDLRSTCYVFMFVIGNLFVEDVKLSQEHKLLDIEAISLFSLIIR